MVLYFYVLTFLDSYILMFLYSYIFMFLHSYILYSYIENDDFCRWLHACEDIAAREKGGFSITDKFCITDTFCIKMMDLVSNRMGFVSKMMNFVSK